MISSITKVEESAATKQTRDRLKDELEAMNKKITAEALKATSQAIKSALGSPLQREASSLFDQNRNPAQMGQEVKKMAERLALKLSQSK